MNTDQPELIRAINEGDVQRTKLLLATGLDVNEAEEGHNGWTPLFYAIEAEDETTQLEIIRLLIAHNADLNKRTRFLEMTPLILAASLNRNKISSLLLLSGADPNLISNEGETPLLLAVEERNRELTELLLTHGATNTINHFGGDHGKTALGLAASQLDEEIVTILLRFNADKDLNDDEHVGAKGHVPARTSDNRQTWEAIMRLLSDV